MKKKYNKILLFMQYYLIALLIKLVKSSKEGI